MDEDLIPGIEIQTEHTEHEGPPRVAVYARYSSPKQRSIEAQIAEARTRSEERGWKVRYVLTDEAKSGKDLERTGYQRLIDLAESGRIDIIVVWKMDRLGRSLRELAGLHDYMTELGVSLHSCTEPLDSTHKMGRFIWGILANVAELERDMLIERVLMGIHHSASKGKWPRPFVPFGYRRTRGNHLRVFPPEAEVVVRVFQAYLAAGSYAETAQALNTGGQDFRGKRWTASSVQKILERPAYRGVLRVGDTEYENENLRIVPEHLETMVRRARRMGARNGRPAREQTRLAAIDRVFTQYVQGLDALDETSG